MQMTSEQKLAYVSEARSRFRENLEVDIIKEIDTLMDDETLTEEDIFKMLDAVVNWNNAEFIRETIRNLFEAEEDEESEGDEEEEIEAPDDDEQEESIEPVISPKE